MYRQACEKGTTLRKETETFFASLDIYSYMAHYVARVLSQTPSSILDGWGVPELIVAYGIYANEESYKNWQEWKFHNDKTFRKNEPPEKYAVRFYSPDDLEEKGEDEPNGN